VKRGRRSRRTNSYFAASPAIPSLTDGLNQRARLVIWLRPRGPLRVPTGCHRLRLPIGRDGMASGGLHVRQRASWRALRLIRAGLLVIMTFAQPPHPLPGVVAGAHPRPPRCPTCRKAAEWASRRRAVAECTGGHRYAVRPCDARGCRSVATTLHGEDRFAWRCTAGHHFAKRLCPCCHQLADQKGNRGWWQCRATRDLFSVHDCALCSATGREAYAGRLKNRGITVCELVEHPGVGRR
jgi:hypothetical protein